MGDAGAATGANDSDECVLIGYYRDGVPVYGLCKDSDGMEMTSCYECTGTCTYSVTTAGGTYSDLGSMYTDYEYRQALEHFCTSDDDVFPPKNVTAILPTLREHVTWTWRTVQSTQQLASTATS